MSPNDIEVLLYYHRSRDPHERIDAPAVQDATDRFLEARLIIPRNESLVPDAYKLTEGGEMLVKQLCAVPFPVLKWVAGDELVGCGVLTRGSNSEAELKNEIVEAAVQYVKGVGYDGSSLQQEHEATAQFVDNYNAFMSSVRALIKAREESK
jgi:hypothetical protein